MSSCELIQATADQRVEVFGSNGMVQAHNNTPDQDVYFNAEGVHSAKPLYFFLERYMESFVAELKEFAQSIRENTSPPVTGFDGRIPVVIGMAAKKSYLEHRPVRLTEITASVFNLINNLNTQRIPSTEHNQ